MLNDNKVIHNILVAVFVVATVLFILALFTIYKGYILKSGVDINVHIKRAIIGEGYSLNSIFYKLINKIPTSNHNIFYIIYNMILPIFTIIITAICILAYIRFNENTQIPMIYALYLSLFLMFVCFIQIPSIFPYYYRNESNPNLSSLVTQPWHSDTYNLMRLFACPAFFLFLIIYKKITEDESLPKKEILLFTICLFIANWAKPSFGLCFLPVTFLICFLSLMRLRKKVFTKLLVLGIGFLVSLSCLPFQYNKLFGNETENHIIFTFERIKCGTPIEWAGVLLLSLTFPIIATIIIKLINKKGKMLDIYFVWGIYILSLFLRFFFKQIGPRESANDFAWSSFIAAFFLFAILAIKLYVITIKTKSKWTLCPWTAFFLHVAMGINYFTLIYGGQIY